MTALVAWLHILYILDAHTANPLLSTYLSRLQADNHGEGGIFSLYALVRRYGKWLAMPAIIGAGTLLADGIITPPISVTSAIEGLSNVPALASYFCAGRASLFWV